MKKERSFRPPQTVLDTVSRFEGDPSIVKLNSGAVPLSDLRKMHAFLRSQEIIAKGDDWEHQGGNAGLMWSRRVLRQEGIIKASNVGDTFIPEAIDIQLGPNIVAAFTTENIESLAKKFSDEGIPSSMVTVDGKTLAFWSGEMTKSYTVMDGTAQIPEIELGNVTMIDESHNKVNTIYKASTNGKAGVKCEPLVGIPHLIKSEWQSAYLLSSDDCQVTQARIIKVDDDLGLVMGWAIICTVDGEPYFDKQGDHITESGMLEASTDFMKSFRVAKEMHVGDEKGTIVFAWPMTDEIAKAFGVEVDQTGLMIAMKPDSDEMLEKFRDGTYNGFSIGGKRLPDFTEEVD
jgi:Putative phage serine protease XkdF